MNFSLWHLIVTADPLWLIAWSFLSGYVSALVVWASSVSRRLNAGSRRG